MKNTSSSLQPKDRLIKKTGATSLQIENIPLNKTVSTGTQLKDDFINTIDSSNASRSRKLPFGFLVSQEKKELHQVKSDGMNDLERDGADPNDDDDIQLITDPNKFSHNLVQGVDMVKSISMKSDTLSTRPILSQRIYKNQ